MDRFEDAGDLAQGQQVVIAARWILVGAGLLLALWNPASVGDLKVYLVVILGLAVANFYLQSQLLMRKPVITPVAYGASAGDIVAISLMVMAGDGFGSPLFVFYLPAVLAISVAFRTETTAVFTAAAIGMYGLISLPTVVDGSETALLTRLMVIVAVAISGNTYWRIERDRREAAAHPPGYEDQYVELEAEPVRTRNS